MNPGYSLNNFLIKVGTSDIEESEDNEDDEFEKNLEENLEENRIKMSRELSNLSIEGDCKKQKTDVGSVLNFSSILPTWGGNIVLNSDDQLKLFNNFKIIDTCTIDYFLLAISYSSIINVQIKNYLNNSTRLDKTNSLKSKLNEIVNLILQNEWNKAKTIRILNVLKLEPKRRCFSTFGDEFDFYIKHVKELQLLNYTCSNRSCRNSVHTNDELYF